MPISSDSIIDVDANIDKTRKAPVRDAFMHWFSNAGIPNNVEPTLGKYYNAWLSARMPSHFEFTQAKDGSVRIVPRVEPALAQASDPPPRAQPATPPKPEPKPAAAVPAAPTTSSPVTPPVHWSADVQVSPGPDADGNHGKLLRMSTQYPGPDLAARAAAGADQIVRDINDTLVRRGERPIDVRVEREGNTVRVTSPNKADMGWFANAAENLGHRISLPASLEQHPMARGPSKTAGEMFRDGQERATAQKLGTAERGPLDPLHSARATLSSPPNPIGADHEVPKPDQHTPGQSAPATPEAELAAARRDAIDALRASDPARADKLEETYRRAAEMQAEADSKAQRAANETARDSIARDPRRAAALSQASLADQVAASRLFAQADAIGAKALATTVHQPTEASTRAVNVLQHSVDTNHAYISQHQSAVRNASIANAGGVGATVGLGAVGMINRADAAANAFSRGDTYTGVVNSAAFVGDTTLVAAGTAQGVGLLKGAGSLKGTLPLIVAGGMIRSAVGAANGDAKEVAKGGASIGGALAGGLAGAAALSWLGPVGMVVGATVGAIAAVGVTDAAVDDLARGQAPTLTGSLDGAWKSIKGTGEGVVSAVNAVAGWIGYGQAKPDIHQKGSAPQAEEPLTPSLELEPRPGPPAQQFTPHGVTRASHETEPAGGSMKLTLHGAPTPGAIPTVLGGSAADLRMQSAQIEVTGSGADRQFAAVVRMDDTDRNFNKGTAPQTDTKIADATPARRPDQKGAEAARV